MSAVDAISEIPGGFGHTDRCFLHQNQIIRFYRCVNGLVSVDALALNLTEGNRDNREFQFLLYPLCLLLFKLPVVGTTSAACGRGANLP
jgi:hypothetical protein